jgi:hypothetical protein
MTHFEPQSPDMIGQSDERLERLQHGYSDEELLIELRRRGRLARVETEVVVPQRYVEDGFPIEMQIKKAWREFAYEAARLHVGGTKPTGAKVDTVVGDGVTRSPLERSRRVRFAVNYVVDRK